MMSFKCQSERVHLSLDYAAGYNDSCLTSNTAGDFSYGTPGNSLVVGECETLILPVWLYFGIFGVKPGKIIKYYKNVGQGIALITSKCLQMCNPD